MKMTRLVTWNLTNALVFYDLTQDLALGTRDLVWDLVEILFDLLERKNKQVYVYKVWRTEHRKRVEHTIPSLSQYIK